MHEERLFAFFGKQFIHVLQLLRYRVTELASKSSNRIATCRAVPCVVLRCVALRCVALRCGVARGMNEALAGHFYCPSSLRYISRES